MNLAKLLTQCIFWAGHNQTSRVLVGSEFWSEYRFGFRKDVDTETRCGTCAGHIRVYTNSKGAERVWV